MSKTPTIVIAKVGEIITKRPEGMDYETYREAQRAQDRFFKGFYEGRKDNLRIGYIRGRLEGICIPPQQYVNSHNPQIVIR